MKARKRKTQIATKKGEPLTATIYPLPKLGVPIATKKREPLTAGERNEVSAMHTPIIGIGVYRKQLQPFASDASADNTALEYVANSLRDMKCRDPLEEMLVMQAIWTHARLAHLSSVANQQTGRENLKAVHEAADRAANTFRKQMLAIAEYRRPPRTDSFVAIKQANVAQQQVIANENQNFQKSIPSNEVGLPGKALPAHTDGIGFAAAIGGLEQAVAIQHRAENDGGQVGIPDERPETR